MSPAARGGILATIGIVVQVIMQIAAIRPLLDLSWGTTWVLVALGAFAAGVFGLVTGLKEIYSLGPRAVWAFILDISWSFINTLIGLIWLLICTARGSFTPPTAETQKRGIITFAGAALPGADATTIGTVMGGRWLVHEAVHVQQARIFGPFYWPVYLLSYVLAMLSRFLTIRFSDPHWEAYGRVVMEDWAYHAAPGNEIKPAPTALWLFLALINGFGVLVLLAPVPVIGALPALFGLGAIPWWIGLIVLLLYALIRSFFGKAEPEAAPTSPSTGTPGLTFT